MTTTPTSLIDTVAQRVDHAHSQLKKAATPPYQTALEYNVGLSQRHGMNVYLKHEHMQHTGSFKYRGALNRILSLDDASKKKGVITASSGNHGMACAMAAKESGVPLTVFVPENASPLKVKKIRAMGAEVIHAPGDCLVAELAASDNANTEGLTYISPYNDNIVMAGQGTIGLEIFNQLPAVDAVVIAVGGGGLIGGTGAWLKAHNPHINVIGCWPENAPAMAKCLEAGKVIDVEESDTLSDGTAGGVEPGAVTFDVCQAVIDKKIFVSEDAIAQSLYDTIFEERMIIEGAAAVALAALSQCESELAGKNVAVVVCGRNIAAPVLKRIVNRDSQA